MIRPTLLPPSSTALEKALEQVALNLLDIPALCELYAMGLCRAPRFLPPWVSDPRYLLALLTFAVFTNRVNLEPLIELARKLLDSAPLVRMPESESP